MKVTLALALAACASTQGPAHKSANSAVVTITSNLGDAQVYVDGRLIGPITYIKAGIALDPGKHRVELRHDDYFSRYAELDLHQAEKKQLDLDLAPILP